MSRTKRHVLVLAAVLAVSACAKPEVPFESNFHRLDYNVIDIKTSIDPQTGNIIRVIRWRYADGVTTTTTDVILPGGDIERRRQEHLPTPEARFTD
jgi:hypothetical protein